MWSGVELVKDDVVPVHYLIRDLFQWLVVILLVFDSKNPASSFY